MKIHHLAVLLWACAPVFGAYQYFYSDNLTSLNGNNWYINGSATATPTGLTSSDGGNGSLISKLGVPTGNDYEVRTTVKLNDTTGLFSQYLRATPGAPSTGSFYSVVLQGLAFDSVRLIYTATLKVRRSVNGVWTDLSSVTVGFPNGPEIRSIIRGSRIDVWLNGVWYLSVTDSTLSSGAAGVGVESTEGNTISHVDLGALDIVAPSPVDVQTIASYPLPNSVDMQWQGADDGASGIGVARYLIYRDGQFYHETSSAEFSDQAVSPSTTYTYGIVARDFHLNDSTQATFSVTTPPTGTIDPRRVGVRPTGAYWGAQGEQLDTLSGNLNFTLPLLKAMGRAGKSVDFSLSYNSQLWRKDSAATWKLGRDVGYGFGWRLQAGSLTPYWTDPFTIHHYTFIDSTGAEYRLDVSADGNTWTSREGIYLTYDRFANHLYFPDGSFWVMGCISSGTEPDAGTRYPTVIEDTNGNQILIRYLAGVNLPWDGTSARIKEIEDVRATYQGSSWQTYAFTFNADPTPHLTQIDFRMGLATHYHFYYSGSQALNSPFNPPVSFGTTNFLTSLRQDNIGLTHQFDYGPGGSGELTKVTLPYSAYLRWAYQDAVYTGSRIFRSVQSRYLVKASGAAETAYAFTAGTPGDTVRPYTLLSDPTGSEKAWYFTTSGSAWQIGLQSSYEERPGAGQTSKRKQEYTWTQDSDGNPYVASVQTTLDQGAAYEKVSKTEQTLDIHGNVTQTKIYDFGNLATPARTYTNTYLGGSNYASRYIFNRLISSTLSGGGQQLTLVSNTYDSTWCSSVPAGTREYDYSRDILYRGNLSRSVANGVTTNYSCHGTGMLTGANDGQGHSVSITVTANSTVPGVITPNSQQNLAETLNYSQFLGVTSDAAPNSATATVNYSTDARPTSSISVHGATTTYAYTNSPPTTTATTNGHWVKTTADGLGRTVKVENGYGTTTVSIVDTEYDVCACSPLGKVKRVSMPYAPGGAVYWTTYNYDCLGRTLSVQKPDGASATTYNYQGNTVTVTDPAGAWKTYTTDVFGNLLKVTEPDPSLGNVDTNYSYNLRNQLTGVSMPRGGTTQTRTFNYDLPTGRLMSATNPENGTVSYTYNADGTVATKIDAKNQKVEYSYDSYRRVTQIRRYPVSWGNEDLCQRADFYYDTAPPFKSPISNGWGRLTGAAWGGSSCTGGAWWQAFDYTPAGLVTQKTQNGGGWSLAANYTYNNEGKLVSTQYPNNGPTFTYSFDSMGRPSRLTDNQPTPVVWAKDALYNAAGQITQVKFTADASGEEYSYWTETRQYNALGQMTQLTVPVFMNRTYTFSATQNDGRITRMVDSISGETIDYQYDSLKRLISATTTGPQWGQSFSYDGFGNLLGQVVTKGSAPSLSVLVNPANNRITTSGYSYDSNGNLRAMPLLAMSYDVENRVTQATHEVNGTEQYVYDPFNERVWKQEPVAGNPRSMVYFYGVDGKLLGNYGQYFDSTDYNVYFAGKQIWGEGDLYWAVTEDRLGSTVKHFPYGEEPTTTAQDRVKFATYYRDKTTALDYARNRYYARTLGRFTSPDPYMGSARPGNPQTWNRYSYVSNDPVNFLDPSGLDYTLPPGQTFDPLDPRNTPPGSITVIAAAPYTSFFEWQNAYNALWSAGYGISWASLYNVLGGSRGETPVVGHRATSQDCLGGLNTANKDRNSVDRAYAAQSTLQAAAQANGIDWRLLAAIAVRESGFLNVSEIDGAGVGVGVFQITVTSRTGVTSAQAGDLTWAANWAAHLLASNTAVLATAHPNLQGTELLQAVAASYNFGTRNITGNPSRIDLGTARNNYGSNVLHLMNCFD